LYSKEPYYEYTFPSFEGSAETEEDYNKGRYIGRCTKYFDAPARIMFCYYEGDNLVSWCSNRFVPRIQYVGNYHPKTHQYIGRWIEVWDTDDLKEIQITTYSHLSDGRTGSDIERLPFVPKKTTNPYYIREIFTDRQQYEKAKRTLTNIGNVVMLGDIIAAKSDNIMEHFFKHSTLLASPKVTRCHYATSVPQRWREIDVQKGSTVKTLLNVNDSDYALHSSNRIGPFTYSAEDEKIVEGHHYHLYKSKLIRNGSYNPEYLRSPEK